MTEEEELRAAGFDRFGNSWCRAASSLTNGFHDTLMVCTEPEALALARKERKARDDRWEDGVEPIGAEERVVTHEQRTGLFTHILDIPHAEACPQCRVNRFYTVGKQMGIAQYMKPREEVNPKPPEERMREALLMILAQRERLKQDKGATWCVYHFSRFDAALDAVKDLL